MEPDEVDEAEAFLAQFGVKGMHWGIRRDIKSGAEPIASVKTSKGGTLSFKPDQTPLLGRLLGSVSSSFREKIKKSDSYALQDSDGKQVGDLSLFKESPTSMNVVWVEVNPKSRGKGYATAAMKGAINQAKKQGLKTVTLEVPGNAPDARHIYEKLGFKDDGRHEGDAGDIWGGLTGMTLKLDAKHEDEAEAFLEHFGVKGMRWGVRQALSTSDDAKVAGSVRGQAKVGGVTSLSNEQISIAIKRMNLENEYKKSISDSSWKQKGLKFVGNLLATFGKEYISSFIKNPGANAATGGNYAWAYAGAKTIEGVVVNNKRPELGS
jgi:GNAT superfamily N-acetyltransferase